MGKKKKNGKCNPKEKALWSTWIYHTWIFSERVLQNNKNVINSKWTARQVRLSSFLLPVLKGKITLTHLFCLKSTLFHISSFAHEPDGSGYFQKEITEFRKVSCREIGPFLRWRELWHPHSPKNFKAFEISTPSGIWNSTTTDIHPRMGAGGRGGGGGGGSSTGFSRVSHLSRSHPWELCHFSTISRFNESFSQERY